MLYLILTILSSSLVSIMIRLSERKVKDNIAMLTVNYIVCAAITAYNAFAAGWPAWGQPLAITTGMGLVNGVFYLVSFVLLQLNVKRNGVVLSSTFMKLGLLVSMVVSVVIYHEIPTSLQVLGFCLAVAAIILINYRKGGTANAGYKLGLLWLLLCGGMGDAMSKIFEESGVPALQEQFLFFTFSMALVLCTGLMVKKGQRIGLRELLFGILVAIPNFLSSSFLLGALGAVPAVIVYPVYSVGTILVVSLTGVLAFRERLNKNQWIAIGMILIALVLLNI